MEIILSKTASKYLHKTDKPTQRKISKAFDDIPKGFGDIIKLKNTHKDYEYPVFEKKIENYRIIYHYSDNKDIYVDHLVPKNNVKFTKYGVHN